MSNDGYSKYTGGWLGLFFCILMLVMVVGFSGKFWTNSLVPQKQPSMAEVIKDAPNADGSAPKAKAQYQLEQEILEKQVRMLITVGDCSWIKLERKRDVEYEATTFLRIVDIFKNMFKGLEVTNWKIDLRQVHAAESYVYGIYIDHRPKSIVKPAEAVKK